MTMQEMLELFWDTLSVIGVLAGLMIVAFAIAVLYVCNEIRNEMKKDRGVKMDFQEMIWAGMTPPNEADKKWAEEQGFRLLWSMDVPDILRIRDHKARAANLRKLANYYYAGIVTSSRRVVRDLEKEVE